MNILKSVFCIGMGLHLSACVHHVLVVPQATPTGNTQSIEASTTVFKGGQNKQIFECDTGKIKQVEVKQNVGQSLVNVITLGTVFNLEINYDCAKIDSDVGGI